MSLSRSRSANRGLAWWLPGLMSAMVTVLFALLLPGTASVGACPIYSYDSALRSAPARLVAQPGPSRPKSATDHSASSSATDLPPLVASAVAAETAAVDELPGYSSFRAAKADLGSPGAGNVFDHVVEQSQIGRSGFAPEEIHNPFNMNPVSAGTNQLKANYYSSKQFFTRGGTVRDWLTGQSFADQYEFGMDALMRIEQGLPLP